MFSYGCSDCILQDLNVTHPGIRDHRMHGCVKRKATGLHASFSYRNYRQFVPWKDNDEPPTEI